jgi:hypothetical protein
MLRGDVDGLVDVLAHSRRSKPAGRERPVAEEQRRDLARFGYVLVRVTPT